MQNRCESYHPQGTCPSFIEMWAIMVKGLQIVFIFSFNMQVYMYIIGTRGEHKSLAFKSNQIKSNHTYYR